MQTAFMQISGGGGVTEQEYLMGECGRLSCQNDASKSVTWHIFPFSRPKAYPADGIQNCFYTDLKPDSQGNNNLKNFLILRPYFADCK